MLTWPLPPERKATPGEALTTEPHDADGLTVFALGYLAAPNLIFVVTWFRAPPAVLLGAAMCLFLAKVFGRARVAWRTDHTRPAVALIVAAGCAWTAFGGGSHFMFSNPDWEIRDAVLGDLVRLDWPVHYLSANGAPLILRSAIGFFLPAAVLGKVFGLAHVDMIVYVWTMIGVVIFLLLLPLPRVVGWRLVLALLLVMFFSGMDFLGLVIATESMPIFPLRLEWWVPLSYPSLTNQLLWAPNHCLPIWIATLLCFRHRNGSGFFRIAAAALPLTMIWTPFAVIGLLPFATLGAVRSLRRFSWRVVPWDAVVAATVFSLPIALFLTLDIGHIDSASATTPPTTGTKYALQPLSLRTYLLFVSCEFLFLALVLAPHVREARGEFWLATVVLLALPLIRYGPTNDLGLRVSAPSLVVLLVICLQTLCAQDRPRIPASLWIAWLFLIIGAHSAFNEFWRAATFRRWLPDYQQSLADLQGGQPAAHYVGRLGSSPLRGWLKPIPGPHELAK